MVFWGIEVKSGKPITHSCERARGRLRICRATLGIGVATEKSIVQCNVGDRSPVLLCILLPNKTESCHLGLEFHEADDVVFSVIGPRSVHLTGYFHSDTESYGMDIESTQTEGSSYCSNDVELQVSPSSPVLSNKENNKPKDKKAHGKQHLKKNHVIESDCDATRKSEDGDGYLLSVIKSKRALVTTVSDAAEYIPQVTLEMSDKAKDDVCGRQTKEKVDLLDIGGKPESRPANKKIKNKTTKSEEDLNIGMSSVADNQENSGTKCEDQTANGLIIKVVANGPPNGKEAATGKRVKVYYTGMLKESGQVFASNVGQTACNFRLGDEAIIRGWNIGIIGMRVGDKRRLIIPPSMGFGNIEVGEKIPPNSWLVYDIELVGIRR